MKGDGWRMNLIKKLWSKIFSAQDTDDSIHICYPDYEVIEVSVNGTFIPPGNISEIILPNKRMNCFAMQGTFNGKWNMIYAIGAVKIIVMPRSEMGEEKGGKP